MLRIAPSTLFYWCRRFGIRPERRGAGYTDDQLDRLVAARQAQDNARGLTVEEVRLRLGCARVTVTQVVRKLGLERRQGVATFTPEIVAKLESAMEHRRRFVSGLRAIAQLGVSEARFYRIVKEHHIERGLLGYGPGALARIQAVIAAEAQQAPLRAPRGAGPPRRSRTKAHRGATVRSFARELGITPTAVLQTMRRYGIRVSGKFSITPDVRARFEEARAAATKRTEMEAPRSRRQRTDASRYHRLVVLDGRAVREGDLLEVKQGDRWVPCRAAYALAADSMRTLYDQEPSGIRQATSPT